MNMVDEQQAAWAEGLFLVPYGCVRTPKFQVGAGRDMRCIWIKIRVLFRSKNLKYKIFINRLHGVINIVEK